jgi:hypothetical protein
MTNFFSPLSFVAVLWIRDPRSGMGKNQDPGSGINISDTQHCKKVRSRSSSVIPDLGNRPSEKFGIRTDPDPNTALYTSQTLPLKCGEI